MEKALFTMHNTCVEAYDATTMCKDPIFRICLVGVKTWMMGNFGWKVGENLMFFIVWLTT